MPEQRHTTTLDIRVDDREIQQLAASLDRTFDTRLVDKFTEGLEKQSRVFASLIKQQGDLGKQLSAAAKALKEASDKTPGAAQRIGEQATGHALGHMAAHWLERGGGAVGGTARGEMTTSLLKAIPLGGEAAASVVEAAKQYYQMQVAYAGQRAEAFGKTGLGVGAMDRASAALGERFGVLPEEVPGLLSGVAQQTGMTGRSLMGVAPVALGLQRLAGVDQGGTVVGAAGAVGGQVSVQRGQALMKDTLTTAIVAGFQESRFDQYFQSLSAFTEQMRNQGFMMDPESINALVRGFGASNAETLRGMGAMGFAQNALTGMQKGMRGRGIAAAILMKATGVTEGRSYFEAQEDLERNPSKYFGKVVDLLRKQTQNIADEPTKLGFIRNIWEQAGFGNISLSRARDLLMMDPEVLNRQFLQQEGEGTEASKFLRTRRAGFEGAVAPMRFEAAKRMEEISVGQDPRVTKLVQLVHDTDLKAVEAILPPLSEVVTGVIEFAKDLVNQWKDIVGPSAKALPSPTRPAANLGDIPDPLTGLPTLPEEDEPEFRANEEAFGPGFAAAAQAMKNDAYRQAAERAVRTGRAKPFSEGGDPLKGKNLHALAHGRTPAEKIANGGRLIEEGARMIQDASKEINADMDLTSESDLIGGR